MLHHLFAIFQQMSFQILHFGNLRNTKNLIEAITFQKLFSTILASLILTNNYMHITFQHFSYYDATNTTAAASNNSNLSSSFRNFYICTYLEQIYIKINNAESSLNNYTLRILLEGSSTLCLYKSSKQMYFVAAQWIKRKHQNDSRNDFTKAQENGHAIF